METLEREGLFEQYRGEGWEEEYKLYRENWSQFAQKQTVSQYPLLVDIEISSVCNLKCPMCYTITEDFKQHVKASLMTEELYTKIINEIAGKVPAIRLSLRGEPTLHPQITEFIRYAKEHGIGEVSFLTNGSTLIAENFLSLLEAGVDWITISVDGLFDIYERIRKPLLFCDTLEKIKKIKQIKEEKGVHKPVIKVQSIWPAIRENPTLFYNTFAPYVDLIAFNPLIDYLNKDEDIAYDDDFSCPQLYQRLVIGADGLVLMCSNDERGDNIIGDINIETIYEVWQGARLNHIREIHAKKSGFKEIETCRQCYLPRRTESSEVAMVNERVFRIKNYVKRSQSIGE